MKIDLENKLGVSFEEKKRELVEFVANLDKGLVLALFFAMFGVSSIICKDSCDSNLGKVERELGKLSQGGDDFHESEKISLAILTKISPLSTEEKHRLEVIMPKFYAGSDLILSSSKSDFWESVKKYDLNVELKELMFGLMRTESNINPNVKSSAGAEGLMQIMPGTRKFLERNHLGEMKYGYEALDGTGKDIFLGFLHLQETFEYVNQEIQKDEEKNKLWVDCLGDKKCFKNVVIPILITGYNQGKGTSLKLLKYLFDLHSLEILPEVVYDEERDIKNLRLEVVDYLMDRTFQVAKKGKRFNKLDEVVSFPSFGEHGRGYFKKVKRNSLFVREYLYEKYIDKVEAASDHNKIHDKLERLGGDRKYSIGSIHYPLLRVDDFHNLDRKLVVFDVGHVPEVDRRGIPSEYANIYLSIVRDVYMKIGIVPVINSWCRDESGVDKTKLKNSFHKNCMSFDWKVIGMDPSLVNSYKSTLTEYAMKGHLYFKHENPGRQGEHIHVVLVLPNDKSKVIESMPTFYMPVSILKLVKSFSIENNPKIESKSDFRITKIDYHCRFYKNESPVKMEQCKELLKNAEIIKDGDGFSWTIPNLKKEVIVSVDKRLDGIPTPVGKKVSIGRNNLVEN